MCILRYPCIYPTYSPGSCLDSYMEDFHQLWTVCFLYLFASTLCSAWPLPSASVIECVLARLMAARVSLRPLSCFHSLFPLHLQMLFSVDSNLLFRLRWRFSFVLLSTAMISTLEGVCFHLLTEYYPSCLLSSILV